MARKRRPDWPNALHHVMARGIDGRAVFKTLYERDDLVRRLSELVPETETSIYAWVAMPNHLHLLTGTGSTPLSEFMHRLLTGFAVRYNLTHDRKGHVFQGRFKSILVEDGPYFQKLLRYIHLNPLKAGLVESMEALSRYRWCGHGALVGTSSIPWQQTESILRCFRSVDLDAISSYLKYLDTDSDETEAQMLSEGSFILGENGISKSSESLERDSWSCCCRVLGSRSFALSVMNRLKASGEMRTRERDDIHRRIESIFLWASSIWTVTPEAIRGAARNSSLSNARAVIAGICSSKLGLSHSECGKLLNLSRSGVRNAIERSATLINDDDFIDMF